MHEMRAGVIVKMKNTLTHYPRESQPNTSLDVSTVAQMDISVKTALGHPPSVKSAIGPKETTHQQTHYFGTVATAATIEPTCNYSATIVPQHT
jgi:hypothetical protein